VREGSEDNTGQELKAGVLRLAYGEISTTFLKEMGKLEKEKA
jgi:hypothetical protein